jgi:predicted ATP-grasp superfamily ATP-dependent carboligase
VQEYVHYAPEDKFALLYLFDAHGKVALRFMHRMIEERRTIIGPGKGARRGGISLIWQSAFDLDLLERGERLLGWRGWRGFAEVECVRASADGAPRLMEVNARFPGTIGLALREGVDFAYGACLVARGRPAPRQPGAPSSRRGRQDWLTLAAAGHWRPFLRALDPRIAGANPLLPEIALVLGEARRLVRKRLPRGATRPRTAEGG